MPKVFAISDIEELCSFLPTPICIKEVKTQRIIWVNEAAARLSGVARPELMGRTAHELWPEHAYATFAEDLRCVRAGKPVQSEIGSFLAHDGTRHWVRLHTQPHDANHVLVEVEDVTAALELLECGPIIAKLLDSVPQNVPDVPTETDLRVVDALLVGPAEVTKLCSAIGVDTVRRSLLRILRFCSARMGQPF